MKYYILLFGLPVLFAFNNCSEAEFTQELPSVYDKNANGFEIPEEELEDIPHINDDHNNGTGTGAGGTGNEPGTVTNECSISSVCLVIRDNFERDNIIGSDFAWIKFLDDLGRNLSGLDVSVSDHAPASYGDNAVYFTGRTGGSVHSLYLISKSFDLTGFSKLTIEFDYLMASFESYNYGGRSGKEHLKVDICTLGASACGVGGSKSVAASRLNDKKRWNNVFSKVAYSPINQHYNGKNHSQSSYSRVRANTISIDLNQSNINKKQFMMRWNVLLDEGLKSKDPDAGIIDNIVVRAYR